MAPWAGQGQRYGDQVYGGMPMQQGSYPNATASGSPMNYGAYYPPTSYASTSGYGAGASGSAQRNYGSSAANATAGSAYGQYNRPSSHNKAPTSTAGGASTGYAATANTAYGSSTYDSALASAIQNMTFGGK